MKQWRLQTYFIVFCINTRSPRVSIAIWHTDFASETIFPPKVPYESCVSYVLSKVSSTLAGISICGYYRIY